MPTSAELVAPLVMVTGNEELLVERAVRSVTDAAAADGEDAVRTDLEARGLVPGAIRSAATPSLFGGTPVVVVSGLDELKKKDDEGDEPHAQARTELLAYLGTPDPEAVVVLVHSGGPSGKDLVTAAKKAGALVVDVAGPSRSKEREVEAHRRRFVEAELRSLGLHPTKEAVELLVVAVGNDLRALAGSCAQLASDVQVEGGNRVDADLVGRYYGGRAEVNAFAISDHLMRGQTAQALGLLRQMLAHEPTQKVGPMLVGGIAWRVRQRVGQRGNDGWTPEGLATALHELAEADAAIKGGEADAGYALERMLVTIGRARRS